MFMIIVRTECFFFFLSTALQRLSMLSDLCSIYNMHTFQSFVLSIFQKRLFYVSLERALMKYTKAAIEISFWFIWTYSELGSEKSYISVHDSWKLCEPSRVYLDIVVKGVVLIGRIHVFTGIVPSPSLK